MLFCQVALKMGPWMRHFPGTLEPATFDPATLLTQAGWSFTAELHLLPSGSPSARGTCVQMRGATLIQPGEVFAHQWELSDWRRGARNVSEGPERGWEPQRKLSHWSPGVIRGNSVPTPGCWLLGHIPHAGPLPGRVLDALAAHLSHLDVTVSASLECRSDLSLLMNPCWWRSEHYSSLCHRAEVKEFISSLEDDILKIQESQAALLLPPGTAHRCTRG